MLLFAVAVRAEAETCRNAQPSPLAPHRGPYRAERACVPPISYGRFGKIVHEYLSDHANDERAGEYRRFCI